MEVRRCLSEWSHVETALPLSLFVTLPLLLPAFQLRKARLIAQPDAEFLACDLFERPYVLRLSVSLVQVSLLLLLLYPSVSTDAQDSVGVSHGFLSVRVIL